MAEDINNLGQSNQNPSADGFKAVTDKLNQQDKTLGKIAETSNDTGEKIGEMIRKHKEGNENLKDIAKNIKGLADSNKKMLEASEEEKREAKKGGSAGSKETEIEETKKKEKVEKKDTVKSLLDFNKSLKTSLANFLTTKDDLMTGKLWKKMQVKLVKGFRPFYRAFGNIFAEGAGLIFGTLSTALPKLMGNLGTLLRPITFLLEKVGLSMEAPAKFFGRIANFFNETGPFMESALKFIEKAFGQKAGTIFLDAFELGAKIGKVLPFLAVIPTAIQTVVAAFEMISNGDFKGAFKAVVVGFLKGFAAFFTFGLSDLLLDFDKMFAAFSEPLDDIIEAFGYVFGGIAKVIMGTWNDLIKPVFNLLTTYVLGPMMTMFSSIGKAIGSIMGFVLNVIGTVLKPFTVIFKVIFKLFGKLFELLYDELLKPLYDKMYPYIMAVSVVVGYIFTKIGEFFDGISGFFDKMSFYLNVFTKILDLGGEDAVGILDDIWENLKFAFQIIYKIWDIITDYIGDALLFWWNVIKITWNMVYKAWDNLTSLLADGILIWVGWIKGAWKMVEDLWNGVTDALAYGMLWWKGMIDEAWKKVSDTWNFVVDALAEALEPIAQPINEFFDTVKSVWDYLVGKVKGWLKFFGLGGDEKPTTATEKSAPTAARPMSEKRRQFREQFAQMQSGTYVGMNPDGSGGILTDASGTLAMDPARQKEVDSIRALRESMKGGAAGGEGIGAMRAAAPPIVINNSPTTNVGGGGGGAMPVVISPTPVRNNDPTRGLINN